MVNPTMVNFAMVNPTMVNFAMVNFAMVNMLAIESLFFRLERWCGCYTTIRQRMEAKLDAGTGE